MTNDQAAGNNRSAMMNRRSFLSGALSLAALGGSVEGVERGEGSRPDDPVAADRWLEVDLYWFDRGNLKASVETFLERNAPLFQEVRGWRGVIVNVGWLMDYVLDWRGDLDGRIPIPAHMQQESWFAVGGLLKGTTEQRKAEWKERFAKPATTLRRSYQDWTYADLRSLASLLRRRAAERHGIADLKAGSFVLGWNRIYGGAASEWSERQPDAYLLHIFSDGVFNPTARLKADPTHYGAYPHGIAEGTPIYEFFGRQWGSLSRAVGLDAIVLRDSVIGAGIYRREGPYGRTAPPDPAKVTQWSDATAALVRCTKQANPAALVIGYSNAASAVADWRVNCVDLESIANEGYLDAWIDQTWAGAWNEVGVREQTFWNTPYLGWTYQLAYVLLHAAVLAPSRVRHYVLTETFDAWESWDIIHTAPERLRWGIWAYHHAALKSPAGVKMPAGTYISWANQGKRLLSPADVEFLRTEINAAIRDARETREVAGATLVYNRPAMAWQSTYAPEQNLKEWIDEQAGTIMKWPVAISSATRIEWLSQIHSDLPVLQTPAHLGPELTAELSRMMVSGRPVAVFASPAGGLDTEIAKIIGISSVDTKTGASSTREASRGDGTPAEMADIPARFPVYGQFTENRCVAGVHVLYSVDSSPQLIVNELDGKHIVFWDPADIDVEFHGGDEPLIERLKSPYAFVLAARALSEQLARTDCPYVKEILPGQPVCLSAWVNADGGYSLLAANLEEGLSDSADMSRHITVTLPGSWSGRRVRDVWGKIKPAAAGGELKIDLRQSASRLHRFRRR